jgi:hypothetical protein
LPLLLVQLPSYHPSHPRGVCCPCPRSFSSDFPFTCLCLVWPPASRYLWGLLLPEQRAPWDMWIMVLILWVVLATPIMVCFTPPETDPGLTAVEWIDLIVDLMFAADIWFNFRTAYISSEGRLVGLLARLQAAPPAAAATVATDCSGGSPRSAETSPCTTPKHTVSAFVFPEPPHGIASQKPAAGCLEASPDQHSSQQARRPHVPHLPLPLLITTPSCCSSVICRSRTASRLPRSTSAPGSSWTCCRCCPLLLCLALRGPTWWAS